MTIAVGDRIKDNDPRSYGGRRVLTITEIIDGGAFVLARQGALRPVCIRADRIHADGKPRRSGFTLLPGAS